MRLERLRELKDCCSRQIVYAITSIRPKASMPKASSNWQIENRLLRVRDGTFAEDACRVRTGNAPAALAHLRDASLTLIHKTKAQAKARPRSLRGKPESGKPSHHPIMNRIALRALQASAAFGLTRPRRAA